MNAQTKGFEVTISNVIGLLSSQIEKDKSYFFKTLKDLTLTPSWIPWHLQWWGQDDDSYVCMLGDKGKYEWFKEEREWQQELLIKITPIKKTHPHRWYRPQEEVELIGFQILVIHKKDDGSPTNFGNEDRHEEFEVRKNDDYTDFKSLHWMYLKIQERWEDYHNGIERINRVNKKRAEHNVDLLPLDKVEL